MFKFDEGGRVATPEGIDPEEPGCWYMDRMAGSLMRRSSPTPDGFGRGKVPKPYREYADRVWYSGSVGDESGEAEYGPADGRWPPCCWLRPVIMAGSVGGCVARWWEGRAGCCAC